MLKPGRLRTTVTGLLEAGAFLTALFTIATAVDFLHQYLELFSHFRLQYFVVSILLSVLLIVLDRRRYALVMLAMAVFNGVYVVPWYLGSVSRHEDATLTILHSNVLASNGDLKRLLERIDETGPGIVFVQELTPEHVTELAALEVDFPHQLLASSSGSFGLGAWSKIPFVESEVIDTMPRGNPSLRLVIDFDDEGLTIFSTHPPPPMGRQWYEDRNTQLAHIGGEVANIQSSVLLTGDLNISMWATHYRQLVATTRLQNARKGHGLAPSWPTFLPIGMIPIDHVLLSDDLEAVEFRTLPSVGSDHLPVLVTVQRKKN